MSDIMENEISFSIPQDSSIFDFIPKSGRLAPRRRPFAQNIKQENDREHFINRGKWWDYWSNDFSNVQKVSEIYEAKPDIKSHQFSVLRSKEVDYRKCLICLTDGDQDSERAGRLIPFDINSWIHVNCALWSSDVQEQKVWHSVKL